MCVSTISSGTSRQRSAVHSKLECLMESFDILPSLSCSDEAVWTRMPWRTEWKGEISSDRIAPPWHNTSHTHAHTQGQHLPRSVMYQYALDKWQDALQIPSYYWTWKVKDVRWTSVYFELSWRAVVTVWSCALRLQGMFFAWFSTLTSGRFPKHSPAGPSNGYAVCLPCGTNWDCVMCAL
jgi:hypothetical protein